MTIDRLFVIWSDLGRSSETDRFGRHIVGHLERTSEGYAFWYDASLPQAEARGFSRFPTLPEARDRDHAYRARYLFAAFADRIPAHGRADAQRMLREWGVEHDDDQLEILAKSGGVRATDRIELAEYRAVDDTLSRPLEFRIAGRAYIDDVAPVNLDDVVTLRPQPDNRADATALVVDRDGRPAGYVPRQYTRLFGQLISRGIPFEARVVRQLIVPDDAGKWVVRASRLDGH